MVNEKGFWNKSSLRKECNLLENASSVSKEKFLQIDEIETISTARHRKQIWTTDIKFWCRVSDKNIGNKRNLKKNKKLIPWMQKLCKKEMLSELTT